VRIKVSPLPTDRKPTRRLRLVPVKLGARMLQFYRPLVTLGPFQLLRRADGSFFWRWRRRPRRRLSHFSSPPPHGQRPASRQSVPPTRPS